MPRRQSSDVRVFEGTLGFLGCHAAWYRTRHNAAERALRALAVARKNFYGSRSQWSGELAMGCFTILATLRQHGICPRRYFRAYLEACARAGGKAPENLEEFLPWKWSA